MFVRIVHYDSTWLTNEFWHCKCQQFIWATANFIVVFNDWMSLTHWVNAHHRSTTNNIIFLFCFFSHCVHLIRTEFHPVFGDRFIKWIDEAQWSSEDRNVRNLTVEHFFVQIFMFTIDGMIQAQCVLP